MIINRGNVLYFGVAAVIGGVTGYLIADYLVYKLHEEQYFTEEDLEVVKAIVEEKEYTPSEKRIDYTKFTRKPPLEEVATKVEEVDEWNIENPFPVISEKDWEDSTAHEKIEIKYFTEDDTFMYVESEEMIENPDDILGENILETFDLLYSGDPDITYIISEPLEALVKVTRIYGSYATLIMGLSEEELAPPEPPKKTRRKAKKTNGIEGE